MSTDTTVTSTRPQEARNLTHDDRHDQLALIERKIEIRTEIAGLEAEDYDLTHRRRQVEASIDRELSRPFRVQRDEAAALVAERERDKADAESLNAELLGRLASGDASVSESELAVAAARVQRTGLLVPPAERALSVAERALKPYLADNHLAYLFTDVCASHVAVPLIVHKRVEDAPETSPAVIVSQVTPTRGYGTLEAAGEVRLSVVGDTNVDWSAVEAALEATGSEVSVSETSVVFHRATWPGLPLLAHPDPSVVAQFSREFEDAWHSHVAYNPLAERMASQGYTMRPGAFHTGLTALCRRLDTELVAEDGRAVGTARFAVGIERGGGGSSFANDHLEVEVQEVVRRFRVGSIGNETEAGEVAGITLTSFTGGDGDQWGGVVTYGQSGHPLYPATATVEITIEYAYAEPASDIASD